MQSSRFSIRPLNLACLLVDLDTLAANKVGDVGNLNGGNDVIYPSPASGTV